MRSIKMTIPLKQLLLTFIPALLMLIAVAISRTIFHVSMASMTRDVTTLAELHPFTGILSTSGILVWSATFAICAFTALFLYKTKPRANFWFIACSALLTGYLLFDDCFLFHDYLAPYYLGLHEWHVYLPLGLFVILNLITFRKVILKTNITFLLLAGIFLGASLFVDIFLEKILLSISDWEYYLEDGFKWLGIVCWCSYFSSACLHLIQDSTHERNVIN